MSNSDLNEAERPRPSGGLELRPDQMAPGEHLRLVHDHLRREVDQLANLVGELEAGRASLSELGEAISELSMRQNFERFGTFCNMTCRLLDLHHRLEDAHVFPQISRDPIYGPLAAKLTAEHAVVHERLIAVDSELVAAETGSNYTSLRIAIEDLRQTLFSHLGYEDEQLPEPLGVLAIGV